MGQLGSKDEGLRPEDVEPLSRAEFVALQHSWLEVEDGDSLPPPAPDETRTIAHDKLSVRYHRVGCAPWRHRIRGGVLTRAWWAFRGQRRLHVAAAPALGGTLAAHLGATVGKSVSFAEFWPRGT